MFILYRLTGVILTFLAVVGAQNNFLIGLYVVLGLVFQWLLTIQRSISASYKVDAEVLGVLRSTNEWLTAKAIAEKIARARLEQELVGKKLKWKYYRIRESQLLRKELSPQNLWNALRTLAMQGDVEHWGPDHVHPIGHLWRQAQCSPTRGPWGNRLILEKSEGG